MHADFFCSSTIGPDYNPGSQQFCIIIFPETLFFSSTLSSNFFFSIRIFLHGHWRLTGQLGKGGDYLLFHSTTSTRSRTFSHLFATLHVRWLSRIFNRTTCIYQTATWWDLPPYGITIWLIDDVTLSFSLLTWWFDSSFFVTAIWDGKPADLN